MANNLISNGRRKWRYGLFLLLAFAAGALPLGLVALVDPYGVIGEQPSDKAEASLAEKAHYPLWKIARYKPGHFDTVILGDSRARALREKLWREAGLNRTINLAYGGGTIPEIYDTFRLVRDDPSLDTIVVGIQLRSFDEDHKAGMNRVPEAVRLLAHPSEYLKNWFVARTAWKLFQRRHQSAFDRVYSLVPNLLPAANAANLGTKGATPLSTLLRPDVCFSCRFPQNLSAAPLPVIARHWTGMAGYFSPPDRYGHLISLYQAELLQRKLPAKIDRQLKKNAKSDWLGFEFSERYWSLIAEIGAWGKQPGKRVVFFVPPTIAELQQTIFSFGLGEENLRLRERLATLATVLDFDFLNELTAEPAAFSDAYHFRPNIARMIVAEIARHSDRTGKLLPSNSRAVHCPLTEESVERIKTANAVVGHGRNCLVWREAQQ